LSTHQYKRDISDKIVTLATQFPAIVLTGARQTGKTTILRSLFPNHTYVSLDLPADAALAEDDPGNFLRRFPPPLIIDEVQYAPKLFRHLKVAIDLDREKNGLFILTGSQKFTLMKEVSDSLAGRAAVLELEGLSQSELGDTFWDVLKNKGVTNVLCRGFMPQLWKDLTIDPIDFFRSYMATYIERDVRQLLNIVSVRDFDRFMRACAVRSGQLLNKTDVSKDVGISAKTVNEWLSILEASNQITLLEPYYTNLGKRLVKSPKIFFNDVGMLCFLLGLTPSTLAESYVVGSVWETFLYGEIRKIMRVKHPEGSIWFYRDQSHEVDFVIEKGRVVTLLDGKWKEYPEAKDFNTMLKVKKFFPRVAENTMILCRTPHSYPIGKEMVAVNGFSIEAIL
jgi:predicted AAA+ superfamily ATPase